MTSVHQLDPGDRGTAARWDEFVRSAAGATSATSAAISACVRIVSDVAIRARASGHVAATSSASRSTPGPDATRLSTSPQEGQAFGVGMLCPQWWQISIRRSRCSTSQAVQLGQLIRSPQARHRVSGA